MIATRNADITTGEAAEITHGIHLYALGCGKHIIEFDGNK